MRLGKRCRFRAGGAGDTLHECQEAQSSGRADVVLDAPPLGFALRGETHLAYQVAGTGPPEIVFVGGSMATTMAWDDPATAKGFRRLASFRA
jgi:hypothetical protein